MPLRLKLSLTTEENARWGQPFLDEAFLYHLRRLDHRHNFSSAFYPIALCGSSNPLSSFAPQMMAVLVLGTAFARDLPIAWFLQTVAFVTFNKVCTSQVRSVICLQIFAGARALTMNAIQYFLWYLWLLPLVLGKLHLSKRNGALMLVWWVGGQVSWTFARDKKAAPRADMVVTGWMAHDRLPPRDGGIASAFPSLECGTDFPDHPRSHTHFGCSGLHQPQARHSGSEEHVKLVTYSNRKSVIGYRWLIGWLVVSIKVCARLKPLQTMSM